MIGVTWRTARAALGGTAHAGRLALAAGAIALGVALGSAIHLINASAAAEMHSAARSLAGEADLVLQAPPPGFEETLYPRLTRNPDVAAAAPGVSGEVLAGEGRLRLPLLGRDPFRTLQIQPRLVAGWAASIVPLLASDAVMLSPLAARELSKGAGDALELRVGNRVVTLQVIGVLPADAYPAAVAVMDIASAQQLLGRNGRLDRLDLKLADGVAVEDFMRQLGPELPPGVQLAEPARDSGVDLARAYRLNLDMLALVALFTGAFLVFSTQAVAVLRRRRRLALLRALGLTRRALIGIVLGESALIGSVGAGIGVLCGSGLAWVVLHTLGSDLGAGYFHGGAAAFTWTWPALAVFFGLGVTAAMLGGAAPAFDAARRAPAAALRAGDEEIALRRLARWLPGSFTMSTGAALTFAPSIAGFPLFGYVAVSLLLIGAVMLLPALLGALARHAPMPRRAVARLAVMQLAGTAGQTSVALAATLVSTALAIGMLVMITSFRLSLEAWLTQLLPADVYVRAATRDVGTLTPALQAQLTALPGVARVDFIRSLPIVIGAQAPAAVLLARSAAPAHLPIVGVTHALSAHDPPPAWPSEIFAALHHVRVGERLVLPLGGRAEAFTVAGLWRDYARQAGAVVIDRADYVRLTGDAMATDAALTLQAGADPAAVAAAVQAKLGSGVEIASAGELRRASLRIFDRTFAVTYALTGVALLVGILSVSAAFAAQAVARRRSFGVLRHIGATRAQIAALLATEGGVLGALGAVLGSLLGCAIGVVLVRVVNRQSFHWSMELHAPWTAIALFAVGLIAACILAAIVGGRSALKADTIAAVHEDW